MHLYDTFVAFSGAFGYFAHLLCIGDYTKYAKTRVFSQVSPCRRIPFVVKMHVVEKGATESMQKHVHFHRSPFACVQKSFQNMLYSRDVA